MSENAIPSKTQESVLIRLGNLEDCSSVWRLFQAHLNWVNVWFKPEDVVQRQDSHAEIKAMLKSYPSAIAETDGVVIGFSCSTIREPGVLDVVNLYVDDAYRRRGIGSQLLAWLEFQARELEIKSIIATASTNYYPGKPLTNSLFRNLNYETHELTPGTNLYIKRLCETSEEQDKNQNDGQDKSHKQDEGHKKLLPNLPVQKMRLSYIKNPSSSDS